MALATDDPNDPATVLRNKIKAQIQPDGTMSDPDPNLSHQPLPGATMNSSRQGVTDPSFPSPAPAPAAPAAPPDATTNAAPTPAAPATTNAAPANTTTPDATTNTAKRFNTTPSWQSQTPPQPWDPYYAEWKAANPGIPESAADPVGPQVDVNGKPFTAAGARPTGGNLSDPAYRKSFIAWAAQQPGVNPSVKNDPDYWDQAFASGRFGNDQDYALQRMMQAEGAPEGAGGGGPAMPSATSPFTDQVRKMLMDRMGRDTAPVNENDAYIKQPMDAANLEAGRQTQTERTALAERLAASGDTSGSLDRGIQQSAERNAVGLGSLKGKLIQQEYLSRRSDLNDAMQSALNSGDKETAYQLQMALAQLDAQLRREGLGVNMSEFQQDQNRQAATHVTG